LRGEHVVAALTRLAQHRPLPRYIKADNGSEFISKALDKWAYENGVEIDFSRPGKPTDNAKNESFNGRFREECLNAHWFLSLEDARRKIEVWREYYNEARPHSALQWMTPAEFARQCIDRADSAHPEEPEFSNQDRDGNWASLKALRNVPEQEGFPFKVTWPAPPDETPARQ